MYPMQPQLPTYAIATPRSFSAPLTAPTPASSLFAQRHQQTAFLSPAPRSIPSPIHTGISRGLPREVCRDFTTGRCNRGATCRFLHVAPAPMIPTREACVDFARGKCNRGASCKYFHALPAAYTSIVPSCPMPLPVTPYVRSHVLPKLMNEAINLDRAARACNSPDVFLQSAKGTL